MGWPEIDRKLRGLRAGDFSLLVGAPHGGKTLFAMNIIFNNPDMPVLFVTADESQEKIWSQLAAINSNTTLETLEDDQELLHESVEEVLDHLSVLEVVDSELNSKAIGRAIDEFDDRHGVLPKLVIYDYLQVFPAEGPADWNARASILKRMASRTDIHFLALAQPKKEYYDHEPSLSGVSGGGDQQAINMLWVERRAMMTDAYDDDDITWDDDRCPAIHVSLLKAKRGKTIMPAKAFHGGVCDSGLILPYKEALKHG